MAIANYSVQLTCNNEIFALRKHKEAADSGVVPGHDIPTVVFATAAASSSSRKLSGVEVPPKSACTLVSSCGVIEQRAPLRHFAQNKGSSCYLG
jgi:hypothetical protein